ncbi:hypothetical protein K438DRAFT_1988783 [Mycena galopus ATCC 62051]|nr:hypothetical protein K438DRAFT_1988783 [Mycena galopus ATCC 62051]
MQDLVGDYSIPEDIQSVVAKANKIVVIVEDWRTPLTMKDLDESELPTYGPITINGRIWGGKLRQILDITPGDDAEIDVSKRRQTNQPYLQNLVKKRPNLTRHLVIEYRIRIFPLERLSSFSPLPRPPVATRPTAPDKYALESELAFFTLLDYVSGYSPAASTSSLIGSPTSPSHPATFVEWNMGKSHILA